MSFEHYRRAIGVLAQGACTNSKRAECFVKGIYPTHVKKASGPFVWDTDGNRYIDFICGLGTNLIGYANPFVVKAITAQMENGWLMSLPQLIELEAAEKIKSLFPYVDKVRFFKEGTTACMTAIRVARAKTKRMRVLSDGYHGHADPFIGLTPPALGVARDPYIEPLKDFKGITEDVAAVIVEPVSTDWDHTRIDYLNKLTEACQKSGTLLIFDEIITGFRFPKWSVSGYLGLQPDIVCLGKACASGMPLAIVGFKHGVCETDPQWFGSGTYYSESLSLAAMLATIKYMEDKVRISDLWERAEYFLLAFNQAANGVVAIKGYPTRGIFTGDPLKKALFWQEAARAGILFGPSFFVCFDHPQYFSHVLNFAQDVCPKILNGKITLEGEMPVTPFANSVRGQK